MIAVFRSAGEAVFTQYTFGKGTVYFLNYPLEKNFISKTNAFDGNDYLVYKQIFANKQCIISVDNKYLAVTEHKISDGATAVIINYSKEIQANNLSISRNYIIDEVVLGNVQNTAPFNATVIKLKEATH